VRFEFLSLADAANNGPEGKLNVLGFGARILTLPSLPAAVPLVVVGGVAAGTDEAGAFDLAVHMIEPDGTEVQLARGPASIPSVVRENRLPTGVNFLVGFRGPFRTYGLHSIRARFGGIEATYDFVVVQGNEATRPDVGLDAPDRL
jgi:hypothetical protein